MKPALPRTLLLGLILALAAGLAAPATAARAQNLPIAPPWDGDPVSPGLGPTYGEEWCAPAAPGSSIAGLQGSPLALIPMEAVGCTLERFEAEAAQNGVPDRFEHYVLGTSVLGRDIHAVVVNAMETPQQRRDFERWEQLREIQLEDPAGAQALLASFGSDVKIPIFIQGNIHGNEREGNDAMMQVIRDLVTLPRGTNATVDKVLDNAIVVVIPMINPDGRFAGTRANANGFDMNRDWLVQSQPEVRLSVALQQEWLAPVALDMHGYVNPTLIDGLTKPHNPGLEYDVFLYWNQRRLDANQIALAGVGMGITRPVNDYNSLGLPPGHPYLAEGWDDWGPFYTQTYMAMYGVDSSTTEMCSSGPGCNGRFGSKRSQYLAFYSSADFWIDNRAAMMHDQYEVHRRGVTSQPRPNCCDDLLLRLRGFTEDQHNWMEEHPTAFVIPRGAGQRSDAEANRMAQWLLDNGIRVEAATEGFDWNGSAFDAGSYVVWTNQALRGLLLTALGPGQDISNRINQLYAPPGAWSHGFLWGADVVEVPGGASSFAPVTEPIEAPVELAGGVRGGVEAEADWYAVTLRGVSEHRAIHDLLDSGVTGAIAEEPFETTTGGTMPAGSLIFPGGDPGVAEALDATGRAAGVTFERAVGIDEPATTRADRAPQVAILVNSANPSRTDTSESLRAVFGDRARFVSVANGSGSLQNAETDPLEDIDVIYNVGQGWPSASNATARERLTAFFERGGGYIGTSQSANNFSFLSGSGLIQGSLTQSSQSAGGGIAAWRNAGGAQSPVTGGIPDEDFLYLPSSLTYFSATPSGATVAGRYHQDMVGAGANGPSEGFVAGLWRNRGAAANNAPVLVHGTTTVGSRYFAMATNPFSRQDFERAWATVAQAALWSTLTDDQVLEGAPADVPAVPPVGDDLVPPLEPPSLPVEAPALVSIPGARR